MAGSTAFHTWDWLELQTRVHGWRLEPLVVHVDARPVGVAPLLLSRRRLLMEARVPFPYVGPVVPPEHLSGTLLALDAWAREHRVVSSRAEFAPGLTHPAQAAPRARWDVHEDLTWVVDLSHGSVEEFWRSTRRSVRRTLRSAERRGVVVRPSGKTEVCRWLPVFLEEAYGARGLPSPYPSDIGEAVWERYGDREGVCMLSAWVGEEPGGLSLAFGHGQTLYSWAGGGFRSRRADNPGTALYVHEILWALEHGYQHLDEVGAVDEGVSQFKRAFGAEPTPYLVATRTHAPVWRQVRRAYRVAKQGRDRLAAARRGPAGRG
ncbi:GNAT family N-acetyltransferase [Geodermatophilus sp. SYSU D01045]